MYNLLFDLLRPHLHLLFPSVRLGGVNFYNVPNADVIDQPVWQFLATLAVHANEEQQQTLVTSLREIVLENVATATKGWSADSEERRRLRLLPSRSVTPSEHTAVHPCSRVGSGDYCGRHGKELNARTPRRWEGDERRDEQCIRQGRQPD